MGLSRERLALEEKVIEDMKTCKTYRTSDIFQSTQDMVNNPPHYNRSEAKCDCGRRIECIDITRHLKFNIGNAIKYLWRVDLKGASVEDLKKAIWYIQDEIKDRSKF